MKIETTCIANFISQDLATVSPTNLEVVKELVAALLGYDSFSLLQASREASQHLAGAAAILLDRSRFRRKQVEMGSPQSVLNNKRVLKTYIARLENELPDVVVANNVHELAESLGQKYASLVIDCIRENPDYLAVVGAASPKKLVNFRLTFQPLGSFKSNKANWAMLTSGKCVLEWRQGHSGAELEVVSMLSFQRMAPQVLAATAQIVCLKAQVAGDSNEPGSGKTL